MTLMIILSRYFIMVYYINRMNYFKRVLKLDPNVICLGVFSFLNDLSSDMIFPFIPIFLTSVLGASVTFVGVVEGIAEATAGFLKIVAGNLSDRMGVRKKFVVFGYALSAIAKPFLSVAQVPGQVLGVRFIDRVGKGARDAARDTLISLSTEKENLGRSFGFHRGADTLGAALGPLIAFALLPYIQNDLRTLFMLSFVASAIAVFVLILFVREIPGKSQPSGPKVKFEFRYLGLPFLIFLTGATLFGMAKASEAFLLLKATEVGLALMYLPIIYFAYSITFALFSTPAGILSDKIGHRNTYMLGMLIFSATYFAFASFKSISAIWILFMVYGFYSALTEGVGRAIVADLVGEQFRATAYGMYNALTGFAALPAGIIFGVLWDKYGSAYSFYYGASLSLVAFFIFFLLRVYNSETK